MFLPVGPQASSPLSKLDSERCCFRRTAISTLPSLRSWRAGATQWVQEVFHMNYTVNPASSKTDEEEEKKNFTYQCFDSPSQFFMFKN